MTFNQIVTQDVSFGLLAGFRQPFNNYGADVKFANVPYFGRWVLGLDGDYVSGKNTLPNTWNVGLSANYAFDNRVEPAPVYKDAGNFKDRGYKDQMQPVKDDLIPYTADPAVYMPQVLAVPDERVDLETIQPTPAPQCSATIPTLTGIAIPTITTFTGTTSTGDAAPSFSPSSGLIYSITPSGNLGSNNTLSIDPTTGVITAANGGLNSNTVTATVTATNACGVAVSTPVTVQYFVLT